MRLVCPNCDAEYEVDDALVPPEGRDVQCSNCTTTWFQAGPRPGGTPPERQATDDSADAAVSQTEDAAPDAAEDTPQEHEPQHDEQQGDEPQDDEVEQDDDDAALAATVSAVVSGATPRKPVVDKAAMDVIHEEVERETAARRAERGGIETQPDLGLDDSETEDRARAARDRMARRRGLEPQDGDDEEHVGDDAEALTAAPRRDDGSAKRELFPDIEEINSTLSPEAAEAEAEAARRAAEGHGGTETERSKFRTGFGIMLLLTLGLLLLYVYAPQISARVPAASDMLARYVTSIDQLRVSLDTAVEGLVERIGTQLDGDAPE